MSEQFVKVDGVVVEKCQCGSGDIKVVDEGLPPGRKITMKTMKCQRCGIGPGIYMFNADTKAHADTWNSFMRKKKRG